MKRSTKIPDGVFCYDRDGLCPYWSIDKSESKPKTNYCSFLVPGYYYYPSKFGLLQNFIKICEVNENCKNP